MRNNLGTTDKAIRTTIAITIGILVFGKFIVGTISLGLFLFAIALVITCLKGNCPVYKIFGFNTNKNLNDKARIYERNIYERNQTLLKNYLKNYQESSYHREELNSFSRAKQSA
jgi:hypothetical protein